MATTSVKLEEIQFAHIMSNAIYGVFAIICKVCNARYVKASSAKKVYTHYNETASNQRLLESIKQLHAIGFPLSKMLWPPPHKA